MAKLCECCGNKNNSFVGEPLYLDDDKILCCKCAEPIIDELNQLFYIKTKEEFDTLTNNIIGKSKTLFNDRITKYICSVINKRCKNLGFSVDGKNIETHILTTDNSQKTDINKTPVSTTNTTSIGMFDNIGGRIKTLAQVVAWMGIIASVISGIALISIDEDMIFVGFMIMIFGALMSWVSSFVLYGFGQLVENSDKLVKMSKK